jgi:acetylornithine deacetylase/succinyl-diaminopimelate desuccinylase-like protein
LDAVMVGFGLADDRIHSPNENWDVDRYLSSRLTMASILHELAS